MRKAKLSIDHVCSKYKLGDVSTEAELKKSVDETFEQVQALSFEQAKVYMRLHRAVHKAVSDNPRAAFLCIQLAYLSGMLAAVDSDKMNKAAPNN